MIKSFTRRFSLISCSLFAVIVSLSGCGDSNTLERPGVVPVTGVVLYNGDPVVNASVAFMTDKAPRAAIGTTNDKGEFKLTTYEANDGAVVGTHKITVTKVEASEPTTAPPPGGLMDPADLASGYSKQVSPGTTAEKPKDLVPAKYGDMKTTPLSEEVKAEGENHFVLTLAD